MKKLVSICLCFLVFFMVNLNSYTLIVNAEVDTIKPELKSLSIDKTKVVAGESVEITVDAVDQGGSGIESIDIHYSSPITLKTKGLRLTLSSDGKYRGYLTMTENDESGTWIIYYVVIRDHADNYNAIYNSNNTQVLTSWNKQDFSDYNFELSGTVVDTIKPELKNLSIDKTKVVAGENVEITLDTFDQGGSGIGSVDIYYSSPITYKTKGLRLTQSSDGKYRGQLTMTENDESGTWIIYYIVMRDKADNYNAIYNSNNEQVLYSWNKQDFSDHNFELTGTVVDTIKPELKTLSIDKNEVETGESVEITVDAADEDGSGIDSIDVYYSSPITLKTKGIRLTQSSEGKYSGQFTMTENDELGTWIIYYIVMRDKIGNYNAIYNSNNTKVLYSWNKQDFSDHNFLLLEDKTAPSIPSVNEVTDISTDVSGTAEAGSSIIIKVGTTIIGTGNSTIEGEYSVTIPKQKAGTILTIKATDKAGNTSEVREVSVKDVTSPKSPTVNEITDQTLIVLGTAEAASTVSVQDGTTVIGTGTTSSEGNYSVSILKQKAGTKLTLTATDVAGNTSEVKEITVKDVTAPTIPTVNEVTDKSISVTGTAEIGSLITVKTGTTVIGTGATSNEGKYSVAIPKQNADSKLAVTATDESGNISVVAEVTVKDVTGPTAPVVNEVTDTSTTVSGTAEPGSSIAIKAGTLVIGTGTTTNEGKYSISIPKQKAGLKLAVTAMDTKGNISSVKEITVKDVTAPTLPVVTEVTDASTNVTGTAEAGSSITIKTGTTVIGTGSTTNEGKYSVTISKQKAGTKLAITATDAAGNTSEVKEVTVKDVTAPTLPVVNEVTDKAVSVTGSAEASSTVAIKAGNNLLGTAKAAVDGEFSIAIEKQMVGTVLNVSVTDGAGNVSAIVNVTVIKAPAEKTNRIAGTSRYSTAVAISQEGWETAETVVLATGVDFPDALAGGPLAYKENAPILLTKPTSLTAETELEIKRLKAKKVIILGSKGAISLEVEAKLKKMGVAVERIGGKNRFDTAALIAKRLPSTQAVIAYGFNFPDVLSISPYAAKNGVPILLTKTDKVPAETLSAMSGKTNTIIVGSTGAVNDSVMKQFPKPVRYGGKTRYDTGKAIITNLPMGTEKAYIATGRNFPDALAGSVLAARNNAPILLVNLHDIPSATNDLISNYDSFSIFGSEGAVGEEVKKALNVTLQNK